MKGRSAPSGPRRTSRNLAVASSLSSLLALGLSALYGHVHWRILFDNYQTMPEGQRQKWLSVLSGLEVYRLFGLVGVILAICALARRPRWPALIYIPLAILAGMMSLVIT